MKSLINKQQQAGLSLIELMVALVLSMLLMLGVTQIFLSSKATYSANQELSEIQESGRFALDILVQDIANTGYQGQCYRLESESPNCPDNQNPIDARCLPRNHLKENSHGRIWTLDQDGALLGWNKKTYSKVPAFIKAPAGSEGLFIELAVGGGRYSRVDESPNDSDPEINLDQPFRGRIVLISNGKGCDLFENVVDEESVDSNYIKKNSNYNWSNSYKNEFGFDKGFELLEFKSIAYYVAEDKDNKNILTLYRANYNYDNKDGSPELLPLVPGVEKLQLEYGIKNNGNVINTYVDASKVDENYAWKQVAAVKVKLTIKAESGLKKDFSSVVILRNRLL